MIKTPRINRLLRDATTKPQVLCALALFVEALVNDVADRPYGRRHAVSINELRAIAERLRRRAGLRA